MSVVHTLSEMDKAVASVQSAKTAKARYEVISRLLHGHLDYSTSQGKEIGRRRAIFCSILSADRIWPDPF